MAQQDTETPAPSPQPSAPHPQAQVAVDEPSSEYFDTSGANQAKNHDSDVLGQQPNAQDTAKKDAMVEDIDSASGDAGPSAGLEASEKPEPNSGSSARKDEGLAEDGPQSDTQDAPEDEILIKNITTALEAAAPRSSANSGASDQPDFLGPAAGGSQNTEPDSVPGERKDENSPKAEPQPVSSVREMYETRVEELDAVYSSVVPESRRPPKPKANRGAPIDDYDNQVAEYVFSSLMVALPQPHCSGPGTGIAFPPPVYDKLENNIVHKNPDFGSTVSPVDTAAPVSDEGPFEPEVEAILVNYRTWDRELYSKLCLNRFSIRLVGILPGSPGDDVSVYMDVHPLNEVAMQYEALSYVWGNPEPAKIIFVNKVEVHVNPNLYEALISLRQRDSTRRIWIDAICLNQTSFAEKSKEVQKMGQIYSLAKTVNVFLGAPLPSNSTFINSFIKFLNRDDEGQAANRYAKEGLNGLHRICEKCQTDLHNVCKGFIEACLQPWWGRVWTLVSSAFYRAVLLYACYTACSQEISGLSVKSDSPRTEELCKFLLAPVD
jgi:Heterokaryon incompatibility protein (HET)